MKLLPIISLLFFNLAQAFEMDKIHQLKWNDLEVVWVEDERFPTYNISIYFADGALSDGSKKGTSNAVFTLLTSGTNRYSQKDIVDNLEYYGVSLAPALTHGYATVSYGGLVKDIVPVSKKICHLFAQATYPRKEIVKSTKLAIERLRNLVNDPASLTRHIFRQLSLDKTPYHYPVQGKIKDIKRLRSKKIRKHLDYFNKKVKKRIYISGPSEILSVKNVFLNDCNWKGQGKFIRDKKNY